uniref:ADP/ATP translocase n=1 Tax=Oryza brachyantha TaxID=4533 RepID=J3KU57_ORYBR
MAAPEPVSKTAAAALCSTPAFAREMVAGGVAGVVAKTAVAPLDRVMLMRQIQLRGGGGGTLQTFRAIVQAQGARRLYSGLGITYVKRAPSVAVSLVAYDHMKALLKLPPRDHKPTGGK